MPSPPISTGCFPLFVISKATVTPGLASTVYDRRIETGRVSVLLAASSGEMSCATSSFFLSGEALAVAENGPQALAKKSQLLFGADLVLMEISPRC